MSRLFQALARRAGDLAARAAFDASIGAVARHADLPPSAIRDAASRPLAPSQARQEAIYLCVTHFGVPRKAISRVTGLDPAGLSRACTAVEERRECPHFDRHLDDLQLELMT